MDILFWLIFFKKKIKDPEIKPLFFDMNNHNFSKQKHASMIHQVLLKAVTGHDG